MLLSLTGMAIKSLLTLDWRTLCVVTQIHPTSLCPHLFLHTGTHPTNHLMLVSLPANGCARCFPHQKREMGLHIPMPCPAELAQGSELQQRERKRFFFSPVSIWWCAFPRLLQSCTISSPSSAVQTAFRWQLSPSAFTFAPALKLVTGYCSKDTFYALPPPTPIIWIHIIKRLAAEIAHRKII